MKPIHQKSCNDHNLNGIMEQAKTILTLIMRYRRIVDTEDSCVATCSDCHEPHISKLVELIEQKKKITFVLPAFPGKSPNPAKVLGHLPDMAEKQALLFLNNFCHQIQEIYTPGAAVIICSDGRVFSDILGISEKDITSYQVEIDRIIEALDLKSLSTFSLDDMETHNNFDQARLELIAEYGQDIDSLRARVKNGAKPTGSREDIEANYMYCGLTRFLVEDQLYPGQTKSKNAIQKECKEKAYQTIIRSNAWTDLVAEKFPHAVRLSIHPQVCGSKKIGIRLIGTETWMTPWHSVAVKTDKKFILMKHREAKKLNTKLIHDENGRSSHYELIPHN